MKTTNKNLQSKPILPIVKWAGGKRWLVSLYGEIFPRDFKRYIEPFSGGAAVFFYLEPKQAILSDINSELIQTYRALKKDWQSVQNKLSSYQKKHSKEFYYKVRDINNPNTLSDNAARFLYLNRTCFNGLYRVNLKGKFNVPIGTKTSVILETDDFESVATLLQGAELFNQDFEKTIDMAEAGDLIFADPPYTVNHNKNGFLKYNEKIFKWDDQVRLRDALFRARKRDVNIILSNADHDSIKQLYKDFGEIQQVSRHSILAASAVNRRKTTELLITSVR